MFVQLINVTSCPQPPTTGRGAITIGNAQLTH